MQVQCGRRVMSAHAHQTAIDEQLPKILIPYGVTPPVDLRAGAVVFEDPETRYPIDYPMLWRAALAINPFWRHPPSNG